MTPKELLYIEDALGHSKEMQTCCKDFANQIQDAELKTFVSGIATKYGENYTKLYSLLNS